MTAKEFLESKGSAFMFVYPPSRQKEVIMWMEEFAQLQNKPVVELLVGFIEWYREDDMSKFTPQHLADWYLKTKQ